LPRLDDAAAESLRVEARLEDAGLSEGCRSGSMEAYEEIYRPQRAKMKSIAMNLRTSFAPLRVYLAESAKYDVIAHTSLGKVTSELPITTTGTISGDSLNGKITGGGCALQLTNSTGKIEILKGSSAKN
jgi:hypothetical protein